MASAIRSTPEEPLKAARPLSLVLFMDNPQSWYATYSVLLCERLREQGHTVRQINRLEDIPEGNDCVFLLSVEEIVPPEVLQLSAHNVVVHASDLLNAQGRGWSPLTWQILEGKKNIALSSFEAVEKVDAGPVYLQTHVYFEGHELLPEMQAELGTAINRMCLEFAFILSQERCSWPLVGHYPKGKPTYYRRRRPEDSRLDPNRTIAEQFNLLRVVDNEKYPAFFEHLGHRYKLAIVKADT